MSDEIGRLDIMVEAEANRANRALGGMEKRLNRIADSLEKVTALTAGINGFDKFDLKGLESFRKELDSVFKSSSKKSVKVDDSDLKYAKKSMDELQRQYKNAKLEVNISTIGEEELKKFINQTERRYRKLKQTLADTIELNGSDMVGGKAWYKANMQLMQYENALDDATEALGRMKSMRDRIPEITIDRGETYNNDTDIPEYPKTVEIGNCEQYDASEIEEYINNFAGARKEANTFEAQIKSLKSELSDLASQGFSQYDPEYDSVARELAEVTIAQKQYNKELRESARESLGISNSERSAEAMKKASKQAGVFKRTIDGIKSSAKNINALKRNFDNVSKSIRSAIKLSKSALHPIRSLKQVISGDGGNRKGMSWGRMIGSSVLFSFVFQGINAIQKAIKEGSDNLVKYSAEYNYSISSMLSSLLYLKNAFAAAFSPIVNVVSPYISQFIDMMASAANAVGQFMAALTGKGFAVQAKKAWKDYAAGLDTTKDSAGDAAKAIKDLQNYTLRIDELNVLQPNDNSSSGSGSGGSGSGGADISPSDMFETVEVSNSMSKLAEMFKEAIANSDFTEIGRMISNKLSDELESIDWQSIYKKADNFGKDLATFLNGLITPRLFYNLGKTIANSINTAFHSANAFAINFDWSNLGDSLASSVKGFFENWDAKLTGETFSNFVKGVLESITSFVNSLNSNDTFEDIGQKFVDLLCGVDWAGLTWDMGKFFKALSDAMTDFPKDFSKGVAESILEHMFDSEFSDGMKQKFNDSIQPLNDIWDCLFSSLNPAINAFKIMDFVRETVSSKGQNILDFLSDCWESIKIIFSPVVKWFKDTFSGAYEAIKSPFEFIASWFGEKWTAIKGVFDKDKVRNFFKSAFKAALDAVKNIWDGIGDYFKKIANHIISPIGKAVNGIIKGINWVLDKVGSKKPPLDLWEIPKFARGAAGLPEDTIGIVNDQKGSVYKELIVPPDGKPFIPEGRNVMLPLQKGTKIMPADETKALMSAFPHFAGGIGDFFGNAWAKFKDFTGNVLDYITHPNKIVQIALDKFVDISNMAEPISSIAKGTVDTVFDGIVDYIKGIFDSETTVKYNPTAGVEQWRSLATKALQMTGQFTESNLSRMLMQMQTESGGNPNAINNWDINAKNGTPSKGLMQVIDPTFRAYAYPGYNANIYDPLSNMLAAIRYTVSRYGSLAKGWKGHGYASGIGKINFADFLPQLAGGGAVKSGQMFIAREKGPELVANYGNKSFVMNNDQIVQSVSNGVEAAFERQNARTNALLQQIAECQKMLIHKDTSVNIDGKKADKQLSKARKNSGYSFSPA